MANILFTKLYAHPLIKPDDLAKLFNAHSRIVFKKDEIVLSIGKTANEYFLIEEGLFRSFVNDYNGNEITTAFYGAQEILIEVSSLFQRIPSQENIVALTDAVLWKIEFPLFQNLYHSIEGFSEWGRAWMSQQLFLAKQRSINMLTKSASERYLELLALQPQIIKQAPLKYIASYLGITDTSLSRIRKEISGK